MLVALLAVLGLVAGACGGDDGPLDDATPGPGASTSASSVAGSIDVLAAASLTAAFGALVEAFEEANPEAEVAVSFAGSSALATQIREGAPADLFASADTATMDKLVTDGLVTGEPRVFATNRLAIIVEPGNPLGIEALADLGEPEVLYVTAAPEVPIAKYSSAALAAAGVTVAAVSLEPDVKGIVAKVTNGEADAGIVYATDVIAAGDEADGIDLPGLEVVATYPAAVLSDAGDPEVAEAFLAFILSDPGQAILADFGFGAP